MHGLMHELRLTPQLDNFIIEYNQRYIVYM